ncbi:hypothetical protein D9758_015755 [Tetrapyrgos nigripes]|uniref:Uncharacterized protein n=1 Tax=Tetrapyrgos nigripes TaxID=182062 RepID=A0A8H5FIR6_9AGAR|nr:hypothetical protein D9758_015755 [Tetrapyrgos nigripes]
MSIEPEDREFEDREFEDFQAAIFNSLDDPVLEPPEQAHAGVLKDDIKTEFHPNSGQDQTIQRFDDFGFGQASDLWHPTDFTPWKPFRSRLDFEVAEFALHAGLSSSLTEDLIKLLSCCRDKPDPDDLFTIESASEMQKLWDLAAIKTLQFQKAPIKVEYKGEPKTFDVHFRPLSEWVEEIATSQKLAPYLNWDARVLSKFDGQKWERFIEEPWTADSWWRIQHELPKTAKPFFIILYADKNKLSSFGTQKGYPVIARCANLPSDIRNGTGLGGGRLVDEDTAETGKTGFVNFKNAVWHASVRKILESIIPHSETGCSLKCGDNHTRCLFPIPYILSSDYEEQCVMALIRGLGGLCPCPKCLVPSHELSDLSKLFPARDVQETRLLMTKVFASKTNTEKDNLTKEFGLRPVANVFLDVNFMDPYMASSFDELHFGSGGTWDDHLFAQFKRHLDEIAGQGARAAAVKIDSRFSNMPSWSTLNHFKAVTNVSFNDGSKHRDISKIFLYAAHDVFQSTAAFQLLRCLRAYLNINMYGSLDLQTESTISEGRKAVLTFSEMISIYEPMSARSENDEVAKKSWNFIKMHYHTHWFDDILGKGVSRVFGTKINEKMHGPLRKIYHERTNFKNVADQITRIQHQFMVSVTIRSTLNDLDDYSNRSEEDKLDQGGIVKENFYLGGNQKDIALQDLENHHKTDSSFLRFRIRLGEFLSRYLPAHGIPLPGNKAIKFKASDLISPYQYLKTYFQSLETWRPEVNWLRCNPSFYGKPRFDFVLFHATEDEFVFAQLLYLFTCRVGDGAYPVALVQPYKVVRNRNASDRRLGLLRIRKEASTEFIPIQSIVQGILAPAVDDSSGSADRFVMDVLDGDLFLRMKRLYPGFTEVS